jgi:hypothetical protein
MRLRFLAGVALTAILGAAPASAGILGGQKKFPKAISYVGERVERSKPAGAIVKHPPKKYSGPGWGSRFDQARNNYPDKPLMPFVMAQDR